MYIIIWYIQTLTINFKKFGSLLKKLPIDLYVNYMLWSVHYRLEWLCIAIETLNTMLYVRGNNECTYLFNWLLYLRHVICQISISDIMMNVHIHTYVADNTTYHMVYVRLMLLSISYYNIACQYHLQMTSYAMLYVRSICLI
jgi:hypothetical protein